MIHEFEEQIEMKNNDEPEIREVESQGVVLHHPSVPVTLDQLAAMKGAAIEITRARVQVLEVLRISAIRITSPEDWLLFRSKDGLSVGFLADSGCERVRKLYGIEIFNVSTPLKVAAADGNHFYYLIIGDGRCALTNEVIESVEGGRGSNEDFCAGKEGVQLELAVRKAARANLDGSIVRELSGLSSVPVEELASAWSNSNKKIDHCRKGRGFGTQAQRLGAVEQQAPHVPTGTEPHCELCDGLMKFIPAGINRTTKKAYNAFWACPDGGPGKKHERVTIFDDQWQQRIADQREPGVEG